MGSINSTLNVHYIIIYIVFVIEDRIQNKSREARGNIHVWARPLKGVALRLGVESLSDVISVGLVKETEWNSLVEGPPEVCVARSTGTCVCSPQNSSANNVGAFRMPKSECFSSSFLPLSPHGHRRLSAQTLVARKFKYSQMCNQSLSVCMVLFLLEPSTILLLLSALCTCTNEEKGVANEAIVFGWLVSSTSWTLKKQWACALLSVKCCCFV